MGQGSIGGMSLRVLCTIDSRPHFAVIGSQAGRLLAPDLGRDVGFQPGHGQGQSPVAGFDAVDTR